MLYTIGYEGLTIEAFVARLRAMGVARVIDVREAPVSRKPCFSKNALARALAAGGIAYSHERPLGCPREIRDRYRLDGDWQRYTRAFLRYLGTRGAEIAALARRARVEKVCLVCYEADFSACHRSFVARAAHGAGAPAVLHLTATGAIADRPLAAAA